MIQNPYKMLHGTLNLTGDESDFDLSGEGEKMAKLGIIMSVEFNVDDLMFAWDRITLTLFHNLSLEFD